MLHGTEQNVFPINVTCQMREEVARFFGTKAITVQVSCPTPATVSVPTHCSTHTHTHTHTHLHTNHSFPRTVPCRLLRHVWNAMAHAQKLDLVFQRHGRVHLNWRGCHFIRLLAAEVCASAVVMVVMLDTPRSAVECKTTGYPLHLHISPSLPLPCVTVCHQVSTDF